jgi:hypothetical protein
MRRNCDSERFGINHLQHAIGRRLRCRRLSKNRECVCALPQLSLGRQEAGADTQCRLMRYGRCHGSSTARGLASVSATPHFPENGRPACIERPSPASSSTEDAARSGGRPA